MLRRTLAQVASTGRNTARVSSMISKHLSTQSVAAPKEKSDRVIIRCIRGNEMPEIHKLWAIRDMDIGLEHLASMQKYLAPDNWLVAVLDGKIVGSCVQVNITDDMTMQGGLVVCPSAEGLGIARKVRWAGYPHVGTRNITADAVPQMADTYHGWGYIYRDYINVSYAGNINKDTLGSVQDGPQLTPDHEIENQMDVDFRAVLEFDRLLHTESSRRDAYMKWYLDRDETQSYVIVNGEKKVVALGAKTTINEEHDFIGPIYAADPDHAEILFRRLVTQIPEGTVAHMMAPLDNKRAGDFINKAGLEEDAQALRMYSTGIPKFPLHLTFGNTLAGYAGLMPNYRPEVVLRSVRSWEMPQVHELWKSHGMDLGLDHMESMANHLAPDAYLVGLVDDKIVAACGYSNLTDDMTMHAGLVVCPSATGYGIGRKLYFATHKPLDGKHNIVADAVPNMVDIYLTWGYHYKDYTNVSYAGNISSKALGGMEGGPQLTPDHEVIKQIDVDFRDVMEFDRSIHPESFRRDSYMKWYLDRENTSSYVILNAEKKIVALAAKTPIGGGHQIVGPIYSNDPDHAEILFRRLVAEIPEGTPVHMMAPLDNTRAVDMITRAGLIEDAKAIRLYSLGLQQWPLDRIFGNTVAGYAGFLPC